KGGAPAESGTNRKRWSAGRLRPAGRVDPVPPSPFLNSDLEFRLRRLRLCVARSRGHRLGSFLLGLVLRLRFLIFLFGVAYFDAALENRAFFNADAMRNHVTGEHPFATDVQPVRALDVALHLAHDDYFIGDDIGRDVSIAADGDTIV